MTDLAGETLAMNMIEKLNEEHDAVLTENAKLRKELEVYEKVMTKISLKVYQRHVYRDNCRYQTVREVEMLRRVLQEVVQPCLSGSTRAGELVKLREEVWRRRLHH